MPPVLNPRIFTSRFTLYRCTEFVTYTVSSMFAMGYAFSALLAPLRVGDSRVPMPWRKGRLQPLLCARPVSWSRETRSDGCRALPSPSPSRGGTSLAEAVPRAEFALVNDHLVLFAVGRGNQACRHRRGCHVRLRHAHHGLSGDGAAGVDGRQGIGRGGRRRYQGGGGDRSHGDGGAAARVVHGLAERAKCRTKQPQSCRLHNVASPVRARSNLIRLAPARHGLSTRLIRIARQIVAGGALVELSTVAASC
jgi:hypothetical protein